MEEAYFEYAMDIPIDHLDGICRSPKEEENAVFLKGKCGKFDFELNIRFKPFPSEKARDEAYRVWVETYLRVFVRKRLK